MPEYGPYLERIIQVLERPADPPSLLVPFLAALLGGVFAIGAQLIRGRYDENRKRTLLVGMMHQELRKNFLTLYQAAPPGSATIDPLFAKFSEESLSLFGQDVLRKNPEVYLTLPEQWVADLLYFAFRRVCSSKPEELRIHLNNALFLYAAGLVNQEPFRSAARKTLTKKELDEIIPKAQAVLERMKDPPFMHAAPPQ
jgi:hypothetical protein